MSSEKYKPNHDPEKIIPVKKDDDNDFTRIRPLVVDPSKPDPTILPPSPDEPDEEDRAKK